jgi:transposase
MEQLTMSAKERRRLIVLNRVKRKELTRREAAEVLGISLRQMHRQWQRFKDGGDAGLVHRSRGANSPRRKPVQDRTRALELYRTRYQGFGATLFAEKLEELDELKVSHDTARRWLIEEGLLERGRRGRRSRRRRERKGRLGEMVQMDGSPHDWFEGRGGQGPCVLMTVIDDATSRRRARFYPSETMEAAMDCLGSWIGEFGVPCSVYVDRHSIYRADRDPTIEEMKAGKEPVTQFGRAMQELGVTLIKARSPQAKGRVERSNSTMQDRLVKEMRLAGVSGIDQANAWLKASGYLPKLDDRFSVAALDPSDAHRPLVVKLADVLCVKETRSVGLDACVQWRGRVLQLLDVPGSLREVEVWERFDGTLTLCAGARRIIWIELTKEAHGALKQARVRARKNKPIVNNKVSKPTAKQRPPAFGKATRR